MIDLCENFNIKILATPAESPWSNGLCEQHNKLLTDMLLKIKEDTPCSWEILNLSLGFKCETFLNQCEWF